MGKNTESNVNAAILALRNERRDEDGIFVMNCAVTMAEKIKKATLSSHINSVLRG